MSTVLTSDISLQSVWKVVHPRTSLTSSVSLEDLSTDSSINYLSKCKSFTTYSNKVILETGTINGTVFTDGTYYTNGIEIPFRCKHSLSQEISGDTLSQNLRWKHGGGNGQLSLSAYGGYDNTNQEYYPIPVSGSYALGSKVEYNWCHISASGTTLSPMKPGTTRIYYGVHATGSNNNVYFPRDFYSTSVFYPNDWIFGLLVIPEDLQKQGEFFTVSGKVSGTPVGSLFYDQLYVTTLPTAVSSSSGNTYIMTNQDFTIYPIAVSGSGVFSDKNVSFYWPDHSVTSGERIVLLSTRALKVHSLY